MGPLTSAQQTLHTEGEGLAKDKMAPSIDSKRTVLQEWRQKKREQETEKNQREQDCTAAKVILKYQPPKKYYNQSKNYKNKTELSNGIRVQVLAGADS